MVTVHEEAPAMTGPGHIEGAEKDNSISQSRLQEHGTAVKHNVNNTWSVGDWAFYYAQELLLKIHPLKPKSKAPILNDWPNKATNDPDQVAEWWRQYPNANIGCHPGASGLVVIDEDNDESESPPKQGTLVLQQLQSEHGELPDTVHQETGSGRGRQYFYLKPEQNQKIKNANNKLGHGVDIKADGGTVVLPPSIHPDTGKQYEWEISSAPWNIEYAVLPTWIQKELIEPKQNDQSGNNFKVNVTKHDLNRAKEALKYIPSGDRDIWLKVGMAFHSTGYGDEAYHIWDQWSQTCKEKYDVQDQKSTWNSFKDRDDGITLRTLFHIAQQYGWEPQHHKPQIQVTEGELPRVVDQAEQALIQSGASIYQRSRSLIRPTRVNAGNYQGINRTADAPILEMVDAPYLADQLTRIADFQKYDARRQQPRSIDCPKRIADTLLARSGEWNLPCLRGIVEAPTLLPDGSVLDEPGYDPESELLFLPNCDFPHIPNSPGENDVAWAVKELEDLVSTFPFVAPEDKSVTLASILTVLVRRSLPTAPLFAISAPTAGTGKSLLVDMCSMIATGRPAAAMSHGDSDEETEKRLHAVLLQGDAVVNIDNAERPLRGDALCQLLTQTEVRVRILGKSQTIDCPSTATVFATGNNLALAGDMPRRTLLCRMDAQCERPEDRRFERDIYKHVSERRGDLVKAALIILRDYQQRGCPDLDLRPMGSFNKWSTWIRGALVRAGFADPNSTRERVLDSNPEGALTRDLFHAWHEVFGGSSLTVQDVVRYTEQDDDLRDAVNAIAGTKDGINSRILGNWLARHKDQIINNLRLCDDGQKSRSKQWKIVKI